MRRTLLMLLLLLVCALYAFVKGPDGTNGLVRLTQESLDLPGSPSGKSAPAHRPNPVTPISVLTVPPEKMREALRDAYRLRPDKRFLLAVAEIYRFLSGQDSQEVTAEYHTDHWALRYGGAEVGTLPEFPDFSDAIQLLTQWGRTLEQKYPLCLIPSESGTSTNSGRVSFRVKELRCQASHLLTAKNATPEQLMEIGKQLDQFLAPAAAEAARQIDALWRNGARNDALLKDATRALVSLNLQALDRMETADILPAKALALLALTKGLTQLDMAREEALLSEIMEYTAHADRGGRALAERDPVRLFVTHQDQSLVQFAQADSATVEARYLALIRIAGLRNPQALRAWVVAYFSSAWWSPSIFKAGLKLNEFSTNRTLSEFLPRIVLLALAQEVGMPSLTEILRQVRTKPLTDDQVKEMISSLEVIFRTESSTLVENFERGLPILDQRYEGPFLDSKTYQAYFRAHFFSALYILGLHYLDSLSSADAANQFANTLGQAPRGTAFQFRTWYRNLADSKSGQGDLTGLLEDLRRLPNFGAPPLIRTLEEQEKRYRFGDPIVLNAIKTLVSRLDTRPDHRFHLGNYAKTGLLDVGMADKLFRNAIQADPWGHPYLRAWYANFSGDQKRVLALLHSASIPLETRATILNKVVSTDSMDPDVIRMEYKSLIAENPSSWKLRDRYVKYLETIKDYGTARAVIQDWLSINDESVGFDNIFARTTLARMYYSEGKYREGLEIVTPVVKSQQNGAMVRAALLLEKLGRLQDAEKLARFASERYPDDSWTRTELAGILWHQKKHDEAATALLSGPYPISAEDWQWVVGKRFAEMFGKDQDQEAMRAFAAVKARMKNPWDLNPFVMAVDKSGNHELAFSMASQLPSQDQDLNVRAYSYLKAARGKAVALAWLKKTVPPDQIEHATYHAFDDGEFDLLWDLVEQPEQIDRLGFIRLLRAAASIKLGAQNTPRWEELVSHYRRPGHSYYHAIGRHLLGLSSEKEVLALATDTKRRCEISFYLGWKAQAEGRYEDASDWYRIAVETASRGDGEYHWAYGRLYVWNTHGKSLSRLAQDRI